MAYHIACPYCGNYAKITDGKEIYPKIPTLAKKLFYKCDPCNAYVGCHGSSDKPLGTLANTQLRGLRSSAHSAFDSLWRGGGRAMTRSDAYRWLQSEMNLSSDDCHIGQFDDTQCRRVVSIILQDRFNSVADSKARVR